MAFFLNAAFPLFVLHVGVHSVSLKDQSAITSQEKALEAAWSKDLEGSDEGNPVAKIVKLLQNMKSELDYEASHEGEMYDKQVCWCETTTKEKTKAIKDAKVREQELTDEIAERTAADKDLDGSISDTKAAIKETEKAMETAVDLRAREALEAKATQKDLTKAVTNLKNAIVVLSRKLNLAELDASMLSSLHTVLHDAALQRELFPSDVTNTRSPFGGRVQTALLDLSAKFADSSKMTYHRALLAALDVHGPGAADVLPVDLASRVVGREAAAGDFQTPSGGEFLQANTAKSLSLAHRDIIDICKDLLKELQKDLDKSIADDEKAVKDHKSLMKAKTAELKASKDKLDEKEQEFAINKQKLANAKEDKDQVIQTRESDEKLLASVTKTCEDLDAEWAKRSSTRSEEINAVAKAIAILSEDDSMDIMRRATTTLLQESMDSSAASAMKTRRAHVVQFLHQASKAPQFKADDLLDSWHSLRGDAPSGSSAPLAVLAVHAQIDSFTKVKEMMDKMIADLKKEQETEKKMKASCVKDIHKNEITIEKKKQEKKDLKGKIDQLKELATTLKESSAKKQKEIDETQEAIKKATQDREEENAGFQKVVADQRATQEILKKALNALNSYYKKSEAFLQQTPPVQFTGKRKVNAGSSVVVALLEATIEDAEKVEKEATTDEFESQADYEQFVKDSTAVISELSKGITKNKEDLAEANTDKTNAKDDLKDTAEELKNTKQMLADLHMDCDWSLKNFDIRQEARLKEIEAIQKAKGILSGAGSK